MHHLGLRNPMPAHPSATQRDRADGFGVTLSHERRHFLSEITRVEHDRGTRRSDRSRRRQGGQRLLESRRQRLRSGTAAVRSHSRPSGGTGMTVPVGVPRDANVSGRGERSSSPAPPARDGDAACGWPSDVGGGNRQTSDVPHVSPLVRHAPSRERHSNGARAPRSPGRQGDDDRHARPESTAVGTGEPGRSPQRRAMMLSRLQRTREHRRDIGVMQVCITPRFRDQSRTQTVMLSRIPRSPAAEASGVTLQSPPRRTCYADLSNTCWADERESSE